MKNWPHKRALTLLLFLLVSLSGIGQSSEELKKKQQQLKEDIKYKEKLLMQLKEDSKASSTGIVLLEKKISQREELIGSIRQEIEMLNEKIDENLDLINSMEQDIIDLKDEYAKMCLQAYKSRNSTEKLMFIFSSSDFTQAYQRMKYLQQLAEYRKRQAEAIIHTQHSLEQQKVELEEKRKEKNAALNEQNQEKLTLNKEKQQKEKHLNTIAADEAKHRKELIAAQKKADELNAAIKKAIEREIAARKAANPTAKNAFALTPEARELSSNFQANQGKLPWPVDKGEITGRFGEQPHPFLKGIKIRNSGIQISTTENSRARAVFEGEVSKIMIIPGAGKIVMVRHGEFISIYMNLKDSFVSTGDKIKTKEEIGTILTVDGKTEMEFQLWKGTELLNPSQWIYQAK